MNFTFDKQKVQENSKIGSGRVSEVYPYKKEDSDNRWVVKKIQVKDPLQFQQQINGIVSSSNHDHPSILPIRSYSIQEQGPENWTVYVKMPKMMTNFKSLKEDYTNKKAVVSKDQMVRYLYTAASALEYLEKKNIPHQNLKPTNVLLDQEGKIYLSDIGIARPASEDKSKTSDDDLYVAPEVLAAEKSLKRSELFKADAWSLAAVLAELGVTKPKPITPSLSNDAKSKLVKEIIADLKKNYGNTVPDLLSALLSVDPAQRKTFSEVMKTLETKYPKELEKEKAQAEALQQQSTAARALGLVNTGTYLYKKAEDFFGTTTKKGAIEKFEEKKEVKVVKAAGSYLASAAGWWGSKKKEEPKVEAESQKIVENTASFESNEITLFQPIDSTKIVDNHIDELFLNTLLPLNVEKPVLKLALSFKGCQQITDQGLKQLGKLLATHLFNLQYLSLHFVGCEKVTDEGVKQLGTQVAQNLKSLQQLDILIADCAKVTSQSKESIKKDFVFVPKASIL